MRSLLVKDVLGLHPEVEALHPGGSDLDVLEALVDQDTHQPMHEQGLRLLLVEQAVDLVEHLVALLVVELLAQDGALVEALVCGDEREVQGINTVDDLEQAAADWAAMGDGV